MQDGGEDIQSQVELLLTQKLGDTGKKIHSARSRNDQVLVDIKLFLRNEIEELVKAIQSLFELLQTQSEKYKDHLLPGYTHLQLAMPSSFGLWFGAYAESLVDDVITIKAAYDVVNKNPLGSAAGYGSSFPINRTLTTKLLGFDDLNYNVVYAQMGRGKSERIVAQALANVADTLGKLSMDACLYLNQNFGFISFPAELTTGSSIMPHKKNPDVFELIRSHCNRIKALPNEITMMTANLPSGYQSSFPINRTLTTKLLGFDDLNYNVVYAQMGRGKSERIVAQALANVADTLGKLSMDACLYLNQNFGFISFPAELTTGSSIMPHKKNPDVFELIRSHCNRIKALPNEITMITTNLPSGYHRDLQLLKEHLFPAFKTLQDCIEMTGLMLNNIEIRKDILSDEKYKYLFSVEEVNKLVNAGMPFRDAYKKVGLEIEAGNFKYNASILHTHEGSIGNLCTEEIKEQMQKVIDSFPFASVSSAIKRLLD